MNIHVKILCGHNFSFFLSKTNGDTDELSDISMLIF